MTHEEYIEKHKSFIASPNIELSTNPPTYSDSTYPEWFGKEI